MPSVPAGYQELSGSERKPRKGATRTGPADPHETVLVSIYIRPQNGAPPLPKLDSYTPQLGQRVLLSRDELAQRHGASAEDIHSVSSFAKQSGLAIIHTDAARRLVQVSGTVAQVSKAFSTELATYKTANESYRGREGAIHLPGPLAGVIEGIFGLDNRRMARHMSGTGVAPVPVPLTPPQVAKAYDFPAPAQGATGQTIALLEFSGPRPVNPTCGFAQSDIDAYIQYLNGSAGGLKSTNVAAVTIMGSNGNVPGGADNIETTLDIEVALSVAQNARILTYFAPMTEVGWVDAISAIVHDATNKPDILSISWGWPELEADAFATDPWPFEWTQQAFNQLTQCFQAAAAIGMTVLAASGDHGTDCGQQDGSAHVMYPASDPWVISCGGTIIKTISPLVEDTWNDFNMATGGGGATGGGVSSLAPLPGFQASANVPVSVNSDHHQGRGVPDVAGNASPNSGYILWLNGQATSESIGGTSAVAPLYAAMVALINSSLNTKIGYLNPTLYSLGASSAFRDMNDGVSNAVPPAPGYKSGPGWDACTGWGCINGSALLTALQAQFKPPDPCQTVLQRLDAKLPMGIPESSLPNWEQELSNCLQQGKLTQAQYDAGMSALRNPRPVS